MNEESLVSEAIRNFEKLVAKYFNYMDDEEDRASLSAGREVDSQWPDQEAIGSELASPISTAENGDSYSAIQKMVEKSFWSLKTEKKRKKPTRTRYMKKQKK